MQTIFLLTTAFTVSIDSFLCGLSLQAQYKGNLKMLLGITLSVFTLCFIGGVFGKTVGEFLKTYSNLVGGLILYAVAILNLFSLSEKGNAITPIKKSVFKKAIAVGVGVGTDGALACFSLTATGFEAFTVIALITATHLFTLSIAITILPKTTKTTNNFNRLEILAPLLLATLGAIKTASFITAFIN